MKGGLSYTRGYRRIDLFIHGTGNVPNFPKLTELSRDEWDKLVNQFINTPAMITQSALIHLSPAALMTQENSKMQREESCNYWSCSSSWQKNQRA